MTQPTTPKRFRPAIDVSYAKLLPEKPPWITRRKSKGRYAVGVRYERLAIQHLALLALEHPRLKLLEGPWFEFKDRTGRRWCQLDALLVDRANRAAIIYECKYQHTPDAWYQLQLLYYPVIKMAYPDLRPICLMEIVHWHDPQVQFPERYDLTEHPLKVPHANRVAVCIFNPRRSKHGLYAHGRDVSEGAGEAPGPKRNAERPVRSSGTA